MNNPISTKGKKANLGAFVERISQKINTLADKKKQLLQGYKKEVEKAEIEEIRKKF
ncbi:MAG: hypothetical protein QG594_2350 [Bacteroidota bacterium]|jgi:archaellum component FlaC|nr:hypothetical protein [Bacteroidota bacterium]